MKNLWMPIFLVCAGCTSAENDGNVDENLKSGEVTQLAFTSDGKNLVVVNEFGFFNAAREKCHGRLRSFSTADWKSTGDTGEMDVSGLNVAASAGDRWAGQAEILNRRGGGNPYTAGLVFFTFDPATLARKEFEPIQQGHGVPHFHGPAAIAYAGANPLCAARLTQFVSGRPTPRPAFLFDLKAGKKKFELQDYPSGAPGDVLAYSVLQFTTDGKHIVSFEPSMPYQLQFHSVQDGKLVRSMKVKSAVGSLQFSPNGKLLAALSVDGSLLVLQPDLSGQVESKQVHAGFKYERYGHLGFRHGLAFVGDGHLAILSSGTAVELFDTKEWKSVRTFTFEEIYWRTFQGKKGQMIGCVNCVAGSPDGKLLAAGYGQTNGTPGLVRVWETATGNLVSELK